jgi:sulfatase maturation enzyme AslB (radical SAM superfamily)
MTYWCPLPWTHLSVNNNGTLRLCSHSQASNKNFLFNLTVDDLNDDVLNSNVSKQVRKDMLSGIMPEQCMRCNDDGLNSRRLREIENHKDIFTEEYSRKITEPDGHITESRFYTYDLRLGNECNLRCVMCFPGESSKWERDYKEVFGYDYSKPIGSFWSKERDQIQLLIDNARYVTKINFGGGEPFLIKRHKDLLDLLIDRCYAKNIELEYSTNFTTLPDYIFKYWDKFKHVELCISIDGIGDINNAIRYPCKWETIEENLKKLETFPDNVSAFVSSTLGILNINTHSDTVKYFSSIPKIKEIKHHYIYYPKYFSHKIIENEDIDTRKEFVKMFEVFSNNQKQDWHEIFPHASSLQREWKSKYQ